MYTPTNNMTVNNHVDKWICYSIDAVCLVLTNDTASASFDRFNGLHACCTRRSSHETAVYLVSLSKWRVTGLLVDIFCKYSRDPLFVHLLEQRQDELGVYGFIVYFFHSGVWDVFVRYVVLSNGKGETFILESCAYFLGLVCLLLIDSKHNY